MGDSGPALQLKGSSTILLGVSLLMIQAPSSSKYPELFCGLDACHTSSLWEFKGKCLLASSTPPVLHPSLTYRRAGPRRSPRTRPAVGLPRVWLRTGNTHVPCELVRMGTSGYLDQLDQ